MTKQLILEVTEHSNGFHLEHVPSGQSACMGDGVDEEFYNKRLDIFVRAGEEGFVEAWQANMEWDFCTYMEAYFHDLWALEIYEDRADPLEMFLVIGPQDDTAWTFGFFMYRFEGGISGCLRGRVLQSPERYRLVAYLDLNYKEQEAIAEILEEATQ